MKRVRVRSGSATLRIRRSAADDALFADKYAKQASPWIAREAPSSSDATRPQLRALS
jgi:hypothetical protein